MYTPPHFNLNDKNLITQVIEENNFGMLICNGEKIPQITHLPFYIENKESLTLITHLAKANPQWKTLEENAECLLVFNGPHSYVSPSNYESKQNVPTWNYITVHLHCKAELIHSSSEKKNILKKTIASAEHSFTPQFETLNEKYLDAMFDAITGIRFKAESFEAKFKLSQNKTKQEIEKVSDYFERNGNAELAKWMKKINKV